MDSYSDNEIPMRQCSQYLCSCGGLKKYNACMVYDYKKWLAAVEKEDKEIEEKERQEIERQEMEKEDKQKKN